ncbi:MAG TPA: phospholipase D-like domain-containing protein, partial [Chloroflexota bacterium]|nr:phospholipase D-like domain-containing protein [Chloroflexota bacterium]
PTTTSPAPNSAGAWYEILFTSPIIPDRKENHKGGLDDRLVALIDSSRRTLDLAIYDFDLKNVADAMARARQRGVTVRMVTDTDTLQNKNAEIQAALKVVRDAGIPLVDDQRRAIMHHKFAVSDREIVLTGSWNFTVGDTYRLNNNAVVIRSPEIATNFATEFEKMFTQRQFGPTKSKEKPHPSVTIGTSRIETYFAAEEDPSERLVQLIRGAQTKIDFLAFSYTQDALGQAMIERSRAGIKVRGVFERTGSETRFSEFGAMKSAGLEVYQDGSPYVMHHKVIVVDDRYTVFGSFNFSDNAADDNDENLLIVDDPTFSRAFLAEVDRMVTLAKNPVRAR